MIRSLKFAAAFLILAVTALPAQVMGADVQVRTFLLQHMSPEDAAALVAPYVDFAPGSGVFKADAVRGITVRALPAVMSRVDSLLKASDRAPASVRLRFQVIAALDNAGPADPALGGLEAELRSVFRFNGYKQIAQGVMSTGDNQSSMLTLAAGGNDQFQVGTFVNRIEPGEKGTVRMNVQLEGWPFSGGAGKERSSGRVILSTGLTIPFGQSIVVGSGSATVFEEAGRGRSQAILLVVRADPVSK